MQVTSGQPAHEWRGDLYALMGLAYYRQPARAFIEGLAAEDPFSIAVSWPLGDEARDGLRLLSASLSSYRQGIADADLESLQWDYFRMFIGAGAPDAPPWESFYRTEEKVICSRYTVEVRASYERFGLVAEHGDHEPEDHIGLELEFMAHLCGVWQKGRRRGDVRGAAEALRAQGNFLDEHVLQWVPRFCRDVRRSAETAFFAGLAELTEGFLAWDRGFLREADSW